MTVESLDVAVGAGILLISGLWWRWHPGPPARLLAATAGAWWLGSLASGATFLHRGFLLVLVMTDWDSRSIRGRRLIWIVGVGAALSLPDVASLDEVSITAASVLLVLALRRGLAHVVLALVLAVGPLSRLVTSGHETRSVVEYDVLVVLLAASLVVRSKSGRSARAITGLVVDLGEAETADVLQARLAKAVGDPNLAIGYWVPEQHQYVDEAGRALDLDQAAQGRTVTPLVREGQQLGVLVHDPSVLQDPELLDDVVAAARWAVANVRLRAQVRAQVAAVSASQRRILTAADDEGRRLEELLRSGPALRLARVAELVASAGGPAEDLSPAVAAAQQELAALSRGLHPRALTTGGLPAALAELAARCPASIDLDVSPDRLPRELESTLYFVCAEALTNVAKYAGPCRVQVRLRSSSTSTLLLVADDGVGGADPGRGSGVRGVTDRVEAMGGTLLFSSPAGQGTSVQVLFDRAVTAAFA